MKEQQDKRKSRLAVSCLNPNVNRLVGTLLLSFSLLFGTSACTKTPAKPPESQLKHAKKDSRLERQEDTDLERRHLAPPPAYGNKVVMAKGESPKTDHF